MGYGIMGPVDPTKIPWLKSCNNEGYMIITGL